MEIDTYGSVIEKIRKQKKEIKKVVFGLDREIDLLLYAYVARGHVLIEGNPGSGKTLLAGALGRTMKGVKVKIVGRSDLVPADIAFEPYISENEMRFRLSRLLSESLNIVMLFLNEINRTPERTNSVFLDGMQERSITIFWQEYPAPNAIFIADRNSLETGQTFELSEAQRDRFLFEFRIPRVAREHRKRIVKEASKWPINPIESFVEADLVGAEERNGLWQWIRDNVDLPDAVVDYINDLADATWEPEKYIGKENVIVRAGWMPRAEEKLAEVAKVVAAFKGRKIVKAEDVQEIFGPFAGHRIFIERTTGERRRSQIVDEFIKNILEKVVFPGGENGI